MRTKNNSYLNHSLILNLFLLLSSAKKSEQSKQIPALYVFGDSLVDSGNNHYLPGVESAANFFPYGIDFGTPTGRYTNGKTVADFLAIYLGLPFAPPYMGLSKRKSKENRIVTTGINYASAGSGILPDTNNKTVVLDEQIRGFERTVKEILQKGLLSEDAVEKHVSESLFFVSSGVNDHFKSATFRGSRKFASYLIKEFKIRLLKLYSLGARKFLVNNVPPAGCFPSETLHSKPIGKCSEKINKGISFYNKKLPFFLHELQTQLPGFIFVHSDLNKSIMEIRENPNKYGIVQVWKPCCPRTVNGNDTACHPYADFCKNRDTYLFFDVHPTQRANQIYAIKCFIDHSICTPRINIRHFLSTTSNFSNN
ncbi:hypothetical protein PIB30_053353 [Stylosanthes scabra]|uniref:Uncharacterized protein n=1 Tax=Stylosanthes scabra TaxID=79078 RepID=A0ABU6XG76_9FABA|nr:hypothetical protein [Stylosanthes scabra]